MTRPTFRPRAELLESRENPSTFLTESFEQVAPPNLPAGWQTWVNDGTFPYITSGLAAVEGSVSLAALGGPNTASRFFQTTAFPADAGVSASVRSGSPSPISVIARGQNLGTVTPSYLAAVVQPNGRVDLVEVKSGSLRVLAGVSPSSAVFGPWMRVSVQPVGGRATVTVQRLDTGTYLTPTGAWQNAATPAISESVTSNPSQGQVGVGRDTGGSGMAFVDDITVLAPTTVGSQREESFDTTAPGGLPSGWHRWQTADGPGFGVAAGRSLSGNLALISQGNSPSRSRAWVDAAMPADVQASVALFADSLIPASLFVRGSNLSSASPSYYAVTLTRGLTVKLTKVVNGVETTLASVTSGSYVSQQWVKLTLSADGDTIRALVYRTDTKQWLNADGGWQDWPDAALEARDGSIRGGGYAGLARGAGAAGVVRFDDFALRPAGAAAATQVSIHSSKPVGNVSGDVTFAAIISPNGAAHRVEFRLNGVLKSVSTSGPAAWTLDSTLLANGPHTVQVRAVDASGNVGTASLTFTANNPNPIPQPARPEIPRHHDWIRIAQLAYSGTPIDQFTKDRLAHDVDLVVPNPTFLEPIQAVAPNTPQIIYSNVSNLYQGLLTDWLNYADSHGVSRELAFYHVSGPTAWNGKSPSAKPVREFWGVYRTPAGGAMTDVTTAARGGHPAGVTFGGISDTVSIGFPEKFREINFALNKSAGTGWQGVLEYASKVGPDGRVIEWKPLTLLSDTSAGLTRDGRVTFNPPADWAAGTIGNQRLFYVRYRVTAGSGASTPVARTIFGRDYSGANGGTTGVIPAFDFSADLNGDGYLTDAEYAQRRPGFDARFEYESRLFYPQYGEMRYAVNPASSAVRQWAADYHQRVLAANPLADGLFFDNSNGRLPIAGIPVREPTISYSEDAANLVRVVAGAVAPKLVFVNTVGGGAAANVMAGNATGAVEEFLLRPLDANWSAVLDAAELVRGRLTSASPSPYVILDTHPAGGSVSDPRTKLAALAYYYLLADPDRTMIMFFGGHSTNAPWQDTWIGAVSANVGRPTADMRVFATGADPQNPALQYQVFARDYQNALVLYKPRSYTLGVGTGTTANATATTHQLGGRYRVVNADGTLGPVVTQITLRNGEGAVLLRV